MLGVEHCFPWVVWPMTAESDGESATEEGASLDMDRLAQVREQQARNFAQGWPYRQQIAAMGMERHAPREQHAHRTSPQRFVEGWQYRRRDKHACDEAPRKVHRVHVDGVRTLYPDLVYVVRAVGASGDVRSIVVASLDDLVSLQMRLLRTGVCSASLPLALHDDEGTALKTERQHATVAGWLSAQVDDAAAAQALNDFFPCPSYLSLVRERPSRSPDWVTSRMRPNKLQAAQRRLAFALAELGPAETDSSKQLATCEAIDLLCTDLQDVVGSQIQGIDYPSTPPTPDALNAAAKIDDATEMRRLIECGADVDGIGSFTQTALETAVLSWGASWGSRWSTAAAAAPSAAVALLLDAGADPNLSASFDQKSPLMLAASRGHAELVRQLLDGGADLFRLDRDGRSVFDMGSTPPGGTWTRETGRRRNVQELLRARARSHGPPTE